MLVCWTSGLVLSSPQPCSELYTPSPQLPEGLSFCPWSLRCSQDPWNSHSQMQSPARPAAGLQLPPHAPAPHGACSRSRSTRVPTSKILAQDSCWLAGFLLKENVYQPGVPVSAKPRLKGKPEAALLAGWRLPQGSTAGLPHCLLGSPPSSCSGPFYPEPCPLCPGLARPSSLSSRLGSEAPSLTRPALPCLLSSQAPRDSTVAPNPSSSSNVLGMF